MSHFKRDEWACNCGCGLKNIDQRHFLLAEIIRHFEGGRPLTPNSGCRCEHYNEMVQMDVDEHYIPFSSKSKHMPNAEGVCLAGDYPSKHPKKLFDYLNSLFPSCYAIGLYKWGVHVDFRETRARW